MQIDSQNRMSISTLHFWHTILAVFMYVCHIHVIHFLCTSYTLTEPCLWCGWAEGQPREGGAGGSDGADGGRQVGADERTRARAL
jgi:hypothetical protein